MVDQTQLKEFSQKIRTSLGMERLQNLLPMQEDLLDRAFQRMIDRKPVAEITSQEILGAYERITQKVYPANLKV